MIAIFNVSLDISNGHYPELPRSPPPCSVCSARHCKTPCSHLHGTVLKCTYCTVPKVYQNLGAAPKCTYCTVPHFRCTYCTVPKFKVYLLHCTKILSVLIAQCQSLKCTYCTVPKFKVYLGAVHIAMCNVS